MVRDSTTVVGLLMVVMVNYLMTDAFSMFGPQPFSIGCMPINQRTGMNPGLLKYVKITTFYPCLVKSQTNLLRKKQDPRRLS